MYFFFKEFFGTNNKNDGDDGFNSENNKWHVSMSDSVTNLVKFFICYSSDNNER